jgi:hypothetical protein
MRPHGLEFPDEFTFDDWQDLAGNIAGVVRSRQWWAGDLVIAGERFGERASQFWEDLGFKFDSLSACVRVCSRFPFRLRNRNLTFSHHRVVAHLPDREALNWLSQAQGKKWTSAQLREQVIGKQPRPKKWSAAELRALALLAESGHTAASAFLDYLEGLPMER